QVRATARTDADVACSSEPEVRADFDQANVRPAAREVDAAVGRSVVDDEDLVRRRGRCGVERLETALEVRSRVERDDDDRNGQRTFIKDTEDTKGTQVKLFRAPPVFRGRRAANCTSRARSARP